MRTLKLITEGNNPNFHAITDVILTEEKGIDGKVTKVTEIAGPFIQCDVKNRNGRIYPKEIMGKVVQDYVQDRMTGGTFRSYGELDHPENVNINLFRVSHIVTHLEWKDNDVIGRARLLDTEYGRIADTIVKAKGQLGVSSRGLGSLNSPDERTSQMYETWKRKFGEDSNIVTDFSLVAIDIVADPSAPEGFVNGILESKDYIIQGGHYTEASMKNSIKAYKNLNENLKILPKKDRDIYMSSIIKKFLQTLNNHL